MVASVPASASVWQEPQAGEAEVVKIALPSGAAPPPPACSSPPPAPPPAAWSRFSLSHLSNAPG